VICVLLSSAISFIRELELGVSQPDLTVFPETGHSLWIALAPDSEKEPPCGGLSVSARLFRPPAARTDRRPFPGWRGCCPSTGALD